MDFAEIYKRADWYDQMQSEYRADISFYTELAQESGGPVLELACGTGRVTIPIAETGTEIWGVDITESMLERARRKSREKGLNIPLIRSDIRELDLKNRFKLLIYPFSAIGHIQSRDDIRAVLASVKEHLDEGGLFAFDYFNPSLKILTRDPDEFFDSHEFKDPATGKTISITERTRYDAKTQINHILWRYKVADEDNVVDREWAVRIYFPQELDFILESCGFKIDQKYGWFDKSLFESNSRRQVFICSKK